MLNRHLRGETFNIGLPFFVEIYRLKGKVCPMPLRRTVLIIDDEPECVETLSALSRQQGWRVISASNGEEGIALAHRYRPEIVLCDLLMPRRNGFQTCREIRKDAALSQTRLIVVSGRDFESDRQAALEAGADAYLTKPVKTAELLETMNRLCGATTSEVSPITIRFWGVRGSIPTPGPGTVYYGGNTTCLEIRAEDQIIVIDAGTGLRHLGKALNAEFGDKPIELTLLLTHSHWDHIQGMPFFSPLFKTINRVKMLGYEGARNSLETILNNQMESPFFPIGLRQVPANVQIEEMKDMNVDIGQVHVQAAFANHPGLCVGYRISTAAGSVAFFPDNEPYLAPLRAKKEPGLSARDTEFARSQNDKMIEFLHGTDVLIIDSQYDEEEYLHHVGWGHGCLNDVVDLAIDAQVRKLFLFHHDTDHDDAQISKMVEIARGLSIKRGSALEIDAAREGLALQLPV
jgi:phosphoribosyl 1,2-cyclic phosphodiesterase/ActR/RegA family two-component response regulator